MVIEAVVKSPTTFDHIERGVKFVGGAAGAVLAIGKVIEFVGTHWPSLGLSSVTIDESGSSRQLDHVTLLNSDYCNGNVVSSIENWYTALPNSVQVETQKQFGDIKAMTTSVRNSLV